MTPTAPHRPWSLFDVQVVAARRLTPNMVRVTLAAGAPERTPIAHFADCGFDQRIKVVLPPASGATVPDVDPEHWYRELRALPDARRPVIRTYTVRAMRGAGTSAAEIDIDLVLHGAAGPASAWASAAARGNASPITLLGPDARCPTDPGGRAFAAAVTDDLLIAGDETALPAIAAILERLDQQTTGTVLVEVPTAHDVFPLDAPSGMRVRFLPRDGAAHGGPLVDSALAWRPAAAEPRTGAPRAVGSDAPDDSTLGGGTGGGAVGTDTDRDRAWDEQAWDVPETGGIRAWIAGEASAVRTIRRHLVGPCAMPRNEVAFMGYWRLGRSEN